MNVYDMKKESGNRMYIAAHRGGTGVFIRCPEGFAPMHIATRRKRAGGNIWCNTLELFHRAIVDGADIIELDVATSMDNQLFVFHPGMEGVRLNITQSLKNMTAEDIGKLQFAYYDNTKTQFGLPTLDDALEDLKGKCVIHVDRFWTNPSKIADTIRKHHMTDDVIIKTPIKEDMLSDVEAYASDIPFFTMGYAGYGMHEKIKNMNINYVGIETLFEKEDQECATPDFIQKMRNEEILLWVNSTVYDYEVEVAAGHHDDVSIMGNPEDGWGWLKRRGYNIIQTDWVKPVKAYLDTLQKQ